MSTTGLGSEPDDEEELGVDDAPDRLYVYMRRSVLIISHRPNSEMFPMHCYKMFVMR